MKDYYNDTYFKYQREQGEFSAQAMVQFFSPYVKPTDNVLDFGCGGGFLLKLLNARQKKGIEINPHAREYAGTLGIETVKGIDDIENNWADIIISNHALEHTLCPYDIIVALKTKLKINGTIVFIVPHETKYKYHKHDENKHLYTWSEMCIGNLFMAAGYNVQESREILHRFPPNHKKILQIVGWKNFHRLARLYGIWARYRHMTQVRLIATY